MRKISQLYIVECLEYYPETGNLFWKTRPKHHFKSERAASAWNGRFAGKRAGHLSANDGYIEIRLSGKLYKAHLLIWMHVHGYFPENDLDHRDRVRHNNKLKNLRESTRQCNIRNAGMLSTNTSGVKGVHVLKNRKKKYSAILEIFGKRHRFGEFELFDDAVMARGEGEKKHKFPNCCTSSSAYNHLKGKGLI